MVLHCSRRRRPKVAEYAERRFWMLFAAVMGVSVLTLALYAYLTGGL